MAELLVCAVGDSVMWGEGLNTENKFAMRAATSLAQARGLTPKLMLLAHCGAKIKATQAERIDFTNLFPHLFNERQRNRFTVADDAGPDESPTDLPHLHGEIARAFPTIPYQLSSIPDDEAARVDVLLVTGGANDLDFETVFQQSGNFLEKLDHHYERIFHDDIIELLSAARRKCPKALIVLTGYYSAFSSSSGFGGMKDMFLELSGNKNAYQFLSTARLVSLAMGVSPLAWYLDKRKNEADHQIKDAVELAQATSESGESRAHYWMRKAVSDINEAPEPELAEIRGPGVAFASPAFRPENCMFASQSFIWQRVHANSLDDDQRVVRASACPRNALLGGMLTIWLKLTQPLLDPPSAQELLDFHNTLDGPVALREELRKFAIGTGSKRIVGELLRDEIDRIAITLISSVFHPNRQGAARYAAVVHKRAEELRSTSVRERLLAFLPPEQRQVPPALLEVDKTLRRFGLDPAAGMRTCLAHAEPDVLGLAVRTHPTSDIFLCEVFLNLGAASRWKLRHLLMMDLPLAAFPSLKVPILNPHLHPGTTDFFTIDVAGHFPIGDITRLAIEIEKADGAKWVPEEITLSIDGHDVFRKDFPERAEISTTRKLSLGFPEPIVSYKITVSTGSIKDAGTDARVYLTLFGEKGESGELLLDPLVSFGPESFNAGMTDGFRFDLSDLGRIHRIRIRHDDTKEAAGWFLDRVIVKGEHTDESLFYCNRWLSARDDDRRIDRVLLREGALLKEQSLPHVYVVREGRKCHITSGERFSELGFVWEHIRVVPDGQLASIRDGPPA